MNKYHGKKLLLDGDGNSKVTHKNVDYYAVGSVHDSYKYDVIGFSLYYLMKKWWESNAEFYALSINTTE